MSLPLVRLCVATTAFLSGLGCSASGSLAPEHFDSRARWRLHGPGSYTITMVRACECLSEGVGPVRVTVVKGVVTARTYTLSGLPVSPDVSEAFPSVDGLFDRIERAARGKNAMVSVDYDAQFGFPTRAMLDWHVESVDDEELFQVQLRYR